MNSRLLRIILVIFFGCSILIAEQQAPVELLIPEIGQSDLRFIENKGQWDKRVQYKAKLNGGEIFFERDRITWFFYETPNRHAHKTENPVHETDSIIHGHVFRVYFENMQAGGVIAPDLIFPDYYNYFLGNDPSKWAGDVSLYGLLTYKDVYPGIDLRIYGVGNSMKYDFIVQPGSDPDQISLRYEDVDSLFLDSGKLQVETSVRQLTEMPPVAYQEYEGKKQEVPANFVLTGNRLSYALPEGFDQERELIIDPTLIFSTHTGSRSDNWGFTATYDNQGNAYAGGIEWSGVNNGQYPLAGGPIQTTFQGGQTDVTITKFNPAGTALIYSTYLGGGFPFLNGGDEQPHSLIVNNNNELYVFGRTNSDDFPVTATAYEDQRSGGYDIFVTKFNAAGNALINSTYIGGSGDDALNGNNDFGVYTDLKYNYGDDARGEILLDDQSNVYIAACTQSANFPTTINAFQNNRSGSQDGCLIRLDANLTTLVYSSYLGGSGDDAAYTLQLDDQGNIFVAGGTSSTNFPGISGPKGGVADGFVVRFNSGATNITGGSYIGTTGYDQVFLLQIDRDQDIYVAGQTTGTIPIVSPATGPVYSNNGGKQFIIKLNNDLNTTIFSTHFGSNSNVPNISPTAFLVDRCDNVYISGWGGIVNQGGSTTGMPITPDAFQSTTDGSDIYLAVFDRDMQSLTYGTFLGGNGGPSGEHVDGGTCRFDREGVVYHAVCAGCQGSPSFPSTPGVWSPNNQSTTNCNLAIFKMGFDLAGIEAEFFALDSLDQPTPIAQGCAPLELDFDNLSAGVSSGTTVYAWDFGDGSSSSIFEPTHIFQNPGTYDVQLIISDPTSCNISDTTMRQVIVFPLPVADAGADLDACPGDTITLSAVIPSAVYSWSPSTGFLTPTNVANPIVVVNNSITYTLEVTNANGCTDSDQITISTDNGLDVFASEDVVICRGGSIGIDATSNGGVSYSWTPAALLDNPNSQTPTVQNLDTTTVFYVSSVNVLGCQGFDSVTVSVFEVFTLEDTFVCFGEDILLTTSGGVSFSWSPAAGLDNPNIASPTASITTTTVYTVTATSADGCISTKAIEVGVVPAAVADAGDPVDVCIGFGIPLEAGGGITYSWTPSASLTDPTAADPIASPSATTTYTVTVTDINGCTDDDQVEVTVNPLPDITTSTDEIICEGDQIQLLASGGVAYEWSPGGSLSNPNEANPTAFPTTITTYTVIGSDANGCSNTAEVTIDVIPQPVTSIEGENFLCLGGAIVLTASGGDNYIWSTGETTQSIEVFPTQEITISVTAYVGSCEGTTASITVDQFFEFPEASFTRSDSAAFAPGILSFVNTSTGATSYEWFFVENMSPITEENPTYTYPEPGSYEVMLIAYSSTGCSDTAFVTVVLEDVTLFAANAISPNGDGHNDEFYIGYFGLRDMNIQIYSRWGIKVYESDNPDFRWDATYNGTSVPEGAYVYVIRGIGENGLKYDLSGTITVLR